MNKDLDPCLYLEIGKGSFAIEALPKMIADSVYPNAFPESDGETQNTDPVKDEKLYLRVIPVLTEAQLKHLEMQGEYADKLKELISGQLLLAKNNETYTSSLSREEVLELCRTLGIRVIEHYGSVAKAAKNYDPNVTYYSAEPSRLKQQQELIWKVIHKLGYPPKMIPIGGKSATQKICENYYANVFKGCTSFERAWKRGIGHLWQMEFHADYSRRGT